MGKDKVIDFNGRMKLARVKQPNELYGRKRKTMGYMAICELQLKYLSILT